MHLIKQDQPLPGDYYGTIYKGSLIIPIIVVLVVALAIWWFVKRRK